nr:translation factor GTPase family protein [uncultured Mogibacterium sp.]
MSKKLTIGILAHVDAGKTTLSEAMLYSAGTIRKIGRVDKGDSFFDNYEVEKNRGITVFSKQAGLSWKESQITILDTPGHDDFSAEMERALEVIDYALLVISGVDGPQRHTETVYRLLRARNIPTFVFVNKMDLAIADRQEQISRIKGRLGEGFVDFSMSEDDEEFINGVTFYSPELAEEFLEKLKLPTEGVRKAICECQVFPCLFGSALHLDGVDRLMDALSTYTYGFDEIHDGITQDDRMGALVYKIARDQRDERLSFVRVMNGTLKVRDSIAVRNSDGEIVHEKVNQIRIYSGQKYSMVDSVSAGDICAITGIGSSRAGHGLGALAENEARNGVIEPFLTYKIVPSDHVDQNKFISDMRVLEEEEPKLHIDLEDNIRGVNIRLMGEVQQEILESQIMRRFGYSVRFETGSIIYKETVIEPVEGVGHFEPLRHYAEVHLIISPGERGSGIVTDSEIPEDVLGRNWQNLILSHLDERMFRGVLIGAPLTDVHITLAAGKAHEKHTEGGDFRQATYRAVRNGLMRARCRILEPWFSFEINLPSANIGMAMTDIKNGSGTFDEPKVDGDMSILNGKAPAALLLDYQRKLTSYTGGRGRISCMLIGYDFCHNEEEVIEDSVYDTDKDEVETGDSIFCHHGSGKTVKWDEVQNYMHLPYVLESGDKSNTESSSARAETMVAGRKLASDAELLAIFEKTYGSISRDKATKRKEKPSEAEYRAMDKQKRSLHRLERVATPDSHFVIDGYNLINADEHMKALSKADIGAARDYLVNILANYRGYLGCKMTIVFDAYRVPYSFGRKYTINDTDIVYTKENETADAYIAELTKEIGKRESVTVVSSDALVQEMSLGHGALRLSSREFLIDIESVLQDIRAFLDENR